MHHIELDSIVLSKGSHRNPHDGMCFVEAYTQWAELPFNDHPETISRVLRSLGVPMNDRFPGDLRQKLVPFIPRIHNTRDDGLDEKRSYLALDWLIRTYTPAWLDLAGLTDVAAELRALRRIVDLATAEEAGPVSRKARDGAAAARDAAWAAAWDAARAAAWDAAGDAARDAARAAARAAAGDAARAAAGAAAGAAAWAAAWDAARDAARAAARAAAGDAAGAVLKPTVSVLQLSALDLFESMIKPE